MNFSHFVPSFLGTRLHTSFISLFLSAPLICNFLNAEVQFHLPHLCLMHTSPSPTGFFFTCFLFYFFSCRFTYFGTRRAVQKIRHTGPPSRHLLLSSLWYSAPSALPFFHIAVLFVCSLYLPIYFQSLSGIYSAVRSCATILPLMSRGWRDSNGELLSARGEVRWRRF